MLPLRQKKTWVKIDAVISDCRERRATSDSSWLVGGGGGARRRKWDGMLRVLMYLSLFRDVYNVIYRKNNLLWTKCRAV